MTVTMTPLSAAASEDYTTSAILARQVDTSALTAISAQALTDCIVYAQNEIDGLLSDDYTVPFTTVPDTISDVARDLASAEVIKRTLALGSGTAGGLEKYKAFREGALARLAAVNAGNEDLFAAGTLVERTYSRQAVTLITAATPAASMTFVTGMDDFDLRNYRPLAICTATSGSPTGLVKIYGTLDEREEPDPEQIYFDGQREIFLDTPFQFITKVDASALTGGTLPLFALKAVRNTGKTYVGGRA